MIFLFTDFGLRDIYVGQVKAVLQSRAPREAVIDLLHDAPPFNVRAGAYLLAALAAQQPKDSVTLAVVDPGVGGARAPVAVLADGRWFVGPDNGLISVRRRARPTRSGGGRKPSPRPFTGATCLRRSPPCSRAATAGRRG
jgi:S-adenosylmethionine hydrolase